MAVSESETRFLDKLEEAAPSMESLLRQLVETNSFTSNREGVNRLSGFFEEELQKLGFRTSVVVTGQVGRSLVARRTSTSGHRLLLLGHLDTVHPPESSFRGLHEQPSEAGRLTGPGVADMKGGLVVLLEALRALEASGILADRHLTVVMNSDEETGSSSSAEVIRAEAADSHLCLCFEPGRRGPGPATTFVTSRRGFGRLSLVARGRAAHAGVEPEAGASAILELAPKVVALEALSDLKAEVSVNVGLFRGGTASNTVPEDASMQIDYRFPDEDERIELEEAIFAIAARHHLRNAEGRPLVSTVMRDQVWRPAMVRSEATARMAARLISWAQDLGLELVEESRGGSSDAALAADVGCPALCGLGAVGGGFHTGAEWIEASSLGQRSRLAALAISRFYAL